MNKTWVSFLKTGIVHLFFWFFWLVVPLLFSIADGRPMRPLTHGFWMRTLVTMAFFYLNYLWLVPHLLFGRKMAWFILINVFCLLLVVAGEWLRHAFAFATPPPDEFFRAEPKPPHFIVLSGMLFSYGFAISVAVALRSTSRWAKMDAQKRALENEHLKSELSNLKMQLNPHFFFNTLNNIYALIQVDQEQAQAAVHRLGRLMRYHLYETNAERVPISGELEFLDSYVALMRMRSTALLDVDFYRRVEDPNRMIAPLLLVPLVENAFKYGVSSDKACSIRIRVVEKQGVLHAQFKNSILEESASDQSAAGIGLVNLRKRLALIYAGRYRFDVDTNAGLYCVELSIRL